MTLRATPYAAVALGLIMLAQVVREACSLSAERF